MASSIPEEIVGGLNDLAQLWGLEKKLLTLGAQKHHRKSITEELQVVMDGEDGLGCINVQNQTLEQGTEEESQRLSIGESGMSNRSWGRRPK